jgi:hypothetical protein
VRVNLFYSVEACNLAVPSFRVIRNNFQLLPQIPHRLFSFLFKNFEYFILTKKIRGTLQISDVEHSLKTTDLTYRLSVMAQQIARLKDLQTDMN